MKKLLALALALTLTLSLSVTAFAADSDQTITTDDGTGKTTVTYEVQPAYTVTIPATVAIDGDAVTVKAEGVKVPSGQQVVVKLTGTSETDNSFKVNSTEGASLTYEVKDSSNNTIALNAAVLTVNPDSATDGNGASGSTTLTFALASNQTVKYAGTYSGTVTFTVSVEAVPTP